MVLLKESTVQQVARQQDENMRMLIAEMSLGLTIEKAMQYPKVFRLKETLGMEMLVKLVCCIIKAFCDSVKANNTMDSVDILECAENLIETYSHDSVKDFILALKRAKDNKQINTYTINRNMISQFVNEYMNEKSSFIEKREKDVKSKSIGTYRTEAETIDREKEMAYQKQKQLYEMKEYKAVKSEKADIKKLSEFIEKNLKNDQDK